MSSRIQLPVHFQDWNTSSIQHSNTSKGKVKSSRLWYKRRWVIATVAAIIVAIIIATVVPLAVILPEKGKSRRHTSVMMPLYIYPETNASWAPLFSSLSERPDLNFTVIINPSSGPGSSQYPDEHYQAALSQLANYSNVEKLGYVRTGYATRNLSDVISEVQTYAGWPSKNEAFALDGIFFDESPYQFTQEADDFMLNATRAAKSARGIQRSKTVVRNPGVVPDSRFNDTNTDIVVVFEQSYDDFKSKQPQLSAMDKDRLHLCYMVYSLPTMDESDMRGFINMLDGGAGYLFVTDNTEQYYEQFGDDWSSFISAMTN